MPLDLIINVLTFLLGMIVGHWLAVHRDRRREFNEAVQPIRKWLLSETERPSAYNQRPSRIEFDTFMSCLPWWKRRGFRAALERQERARKAVETRDSLGGVDYGDADAIRAALRVCLRYTERQ